MSTSGTQNISQSQLIYMRDIITRQTDYDNETAMNKLKENNYDVLKIIREYMGSDNKEKPSEPVKSVNQQTFREIRNLMDNAASLYRIKKEVEERKQQIIENIQIQQQQARLNLQNATKSIE